MADLTIHIDLDASGIRQGSNEAKRSLKSVAEVDYSPISRQLNDIKSRLSSVSQSFTVFTGNLLSDAVSNLTSKLYEGAKAIFTYSSNLQSTQIGFTSLIGNSREAAKLLDDIRALSRKSPFEFEGLAALGQRLLGAKVEIKQITPLLKDIGNLVAATGKASQERIEGVTIAISQMIAKTKVSAEEMEQLNERGIPGWTILAEYIGKSVAETRKLAEQGRITSDVMVAALQKIAREKFGSAMEQQSKVGLTALTKIKDFLIQAAATYFDPLYKKISEMSVRMAKEIEKQKGDINKIGEVIAKYIGEGFAYATEKVAENAGTWFAQKVIDTFTGKWEGIGFLGIPFFEGLLKQWGVIKKSAVELSKLNTAPKRIDYSRPQDIPQKKTSVAEIDTTALAKNAEKLRQEREALMKAEIAAQIGLFKNQADEIKSTYEKLFDQIVEQFRQSNNPAQFQSNFDTLKNWYQSQIDEMIAPWNNLVEKQIAAERRGINEQTLMREDQRRQILELREFTLTGETEVQKLLTAQTKDETDKRSKIATNAAEKFQNAKNQIINSAFNERNGFSEQIQLISAMIVKGGELSAVEQQRIKNSVELVKTVQDWANAGFNNNEIEKLTNQLLTEQEETLKRIGTLENTRQKAEATKNAKDLIADLDGEIQQLNIELGLSAELSRADAIAKELQSEKYAGLTPDVRELIAAKAQEIDQLQAAVKAQDEYRAAFERTTDIFEDALTKIAEGNWKGLFDSILGEMKRFLIRAAAEWLASKFFKLISGQTTGSSSSGGGFNLGSILNSFFGRGGSSSSSSGGFGTPSFNPNSSGFSGLTLQGGGSYQNAITLRNGATYTSASGPSSNGGIGLAGGIAIAGTAASILGNLIGGRVGGFISNIGSGAATGAMLGSIVPGLGTAVGAAIGAGVGLLQSILGGDPKRKRDKKEKIPQLQKGFADALQQLRALGADKNAFYNDPEGTIAKAVELRGQIASGFGIQMESKKYSRIAQDQIKAKLAEADTIIADLMKLRDQAVRARDVETRLNASFATGVYMSPEFLAQYGDFKRRNGILPGSFTGRDTLPSMLAAGEMVLNPMQISNVIANAGFDPFKNAGIPGYAAGAFIAPAAPQTSAPSSASPAPSVVFQPNITVVIEGEGISEARIKEIQVENLSKPDVQVKLVESYDKGKLRTK